MNHCEYSCIRKTTGEHHDSCPANPNPPDGPSSWVMLPTTYQPDTADSRQESGLTYAKYYHESVYEGLKADLKRTFDDKLFLEHEATNAKCALQAAREQLKIAVQYLSEGKARFSPNTTNSFVDYFIAKHKGDK